MKNWIDYNNLISRGRTTSATVTANIHNPLSGCIELKVIDAGDSIIMDKYEWERLLKFAGMKLSDRPCNEAE